MCFLSLSNLSVGYRRRAILNHLNLSATECELVALIGRNGVGKSTLIRTIARLQPAISGEVIVAGKPLGQYARGELAGLLSIVSTEPVGVSHLTVRQLVSFGRFPHTNWIGKLTAEDIVPVEEAMQLVGITMLADKNIYEISDGERQRAMIARTLAQDTRLILLDEPTAFLDMPNKYGVIHLLHRLTRTKRKTILFSTHDLDIAMQEADKLWLMIDDTLYEGAPEDLVLNHQLARVFEGTKLHFDDRRGGFNIKREDMRPITLAGDGKYFYWTGKALERLGFAVQKCEDEQRADVVVSGGSPALWTLFRRGQRLQFTSVYELSKCLSINNNLK
ncbi:MAG: ABC transporter ATP-binding protein [Bacteroidales bacterium]|jgi:iron complex transport system ATP-binding protein|nr:ABC transporter ATP-binding protein [Bacteroidales bacterium]